MVNGQWPIVSGQSALTYSCCHALLTRSLTQLTQLTRPCTHSICKVRFIRYTPIQTSTPLGPIGESFLTP